MSATLGSNLAKQFERVLSATGLRRVAPCILIIVSMFFLLEVSGFGQNPGASGTIQAAPDPADVAALMQKIRDLEDRIIVMEGQIRQLKSQQMAGQSGTNPPAGAPEAGAFQPAATGSPATQTVVLGGAGGSAAKALNPDISVIGDFIGVAGHNAVQPSPSLQMHESEVGLQAILDPYARGDFFLSFGEEGVESGGGIYYVYSAARGICGESGQNAVGIREGEHAA